MVVYAALLTLAFFTRSAMAQAALAELTAPTPGSALPGASATFTWTAGNGATAYALYLGTSGTGSSNLYSSGSTTATSLTVSGLPANGVTVYARLASAIGGVWVHNDYTFTEAGTAAPAAIVSPPPGSQLSSSRATFVWTAGTGVTEYNLFVGTTGSGSSNLYSSGLTNSTSAVVSGMPTNGSTVYARLYSMIDGAWQFQDFTYEAAGTLPPVQLVTPAPGSQFPGSSVTFAWSAGGATAYKLYLGTAGSASSNLYNSGSISATSITVDGLPNSGVTVYARLLWEINGAWLHSDYTFTEAGTTGPAMMLSPAPGSQLGGSSETFSWTPGTGATAYKLTIGTLGAGTGNLFNSGSTSGTSLTVSNLPTNGVIVYARLSSLIDSEWQPVDYTFTEAGTPAPAALVSPSPGSQLAGSSATFSWTPGVGATQYMLYLGNTGVGSSNLFNSGGTTATSATVNGLPKNGAPIYAKLSSNINGSWEYVNYTFSAAPAAETLSALSCATASFTGAGTDSCTATLNVAAPSGGTVVSLTSNNSSVVVPASVTIPGGATNGTFTASASSVSTTQTATLTASAGGFSATFALQLNAAIPTISVSTASLAYGNVPVNTPVSQTLTLSSTGNVAVTINSATIGGAGFNVSAATFPMTLNPGQTTMLTVQFDPTAAGAASGTLTIASNSSTGASTVVSLSGTGVATLSALSCATASFTGAGTDSCTATLNVAAPSGGATVSLSSSNSAVTVPATVTVAAGATSAAFTATATSVSTTQTVTLTASAGGITMSFPLQLSAASPTLSLSATSIGFGGVTINTPVTQSLTLTSTGSSAVTINSATVSGPGFSLESATFPATLNPNQSLTLEVEFDPTTSGSASGQLTISSNSSTGASASVSLTGTGDQPAYQVNLTWNAPSSPNDPIAGYNVYRAPSGGTIYQLLNGSVTSETTYADTTVQSGITYSYYIETVDTSGLSSVPSSTVSLAIP